MKRFVWLLLCSSWSASCFGDVTINNPSGVCIETVEWLKCGCYPWYTCCVDYQYSHTPPCPGSQLLIATCGGVVTTLGGNSGVVDGTPITINPDGTATAGTPVIKGVQPVPNTGNIGILVGQTLNGQLTGNYVYVPPGGVGSMPVTGSPGDGNQWGIMPMPDGTTVSTSGTGNQTQNPDGTINIQHGTPTFPLGSGLPIFSSDNPSAITNLPPIIPNPPDWGTPGFTNNPAPSLTNGLSNLPPGYNVPNSPIGTNNPTGLPTTGAASTNSLSNGTYSQGVNSLYAEESLDTQAIVNAIKAADRNNQTGQNGVSNTVNTGNNTLKGISNHVANIDNSTQVLTNQGNAITNLLSQIASNATPNTNITFNGDTGTGKANSATANGASQLQALGDKFSVGIGAVGGNGGAFMITLPQGSWDINPISGAAKFPAVATSAPWVRRLSEWAMTGWFLFWLIGEINQAVRDATHLPQGTSAETTFGVGTVTAWIAAGVVFIAITAFITYIGSLVVNSVVTTFLAHPFDSSGGQVVQSGIGLLDSVFDIGLCVSLMAQRFALSFYLSKAYLICAGVVRFAVG